MTITSLSLMKLHLNVDHDLDDVLLDHKLSAAEAWVLGGVEDAYKIAPLPAPITEAILQLAALWYEQREAASFGGNGAAIPFGVHDLLAPYREAVTGHVAP
jgi:hypothetical protein